MIRSPVDKGTLGVHEVKLVVEPCPRLRDRGGVAQHADAPGQPLDSPRIFATGQVTWGPWPDLPLAQRLAAGS